MRTLFRGRPARAPAGVLGLLAAAVLVVAGASATAARPTIPVLLFDPVFEAAPLDEGPDAAAVLAAAGRELRAALAAGGFGATSFNPGSPSIVRATERDRSLRAEDLAHPEREASARKIGALHGARFVLFCSVSAVAVDLEQGTGRFEVAVRVVPDIGVERRFSAEGSARLKPERDRRRLATRLVDAAARSASREAVKQLSDPSAQSAPAQAAPDAASYYAQAVQCLRDNRQKLVVPLLEKATKLDPSNPEYAAALGDAYLRGGQVANALLEFRRATAVQPTSADLRVRLAKAYLQRDMVREASLELRRAIYLAPESQSVRSALVEVYLRNNMVAEAVAELRRMAEARPNEAGIRLDLGDLLVRSSLLEEAEAEYKRAVEIDPQSTAPHERLASLYRRRGQNREALRELLLAQRTPGAGDDVGRYRAIATALDQEAEALLAEAARVTAERKAETLTREDAYTKVKALADRADALAVEMVDLKAPAPVQTSHERRGFAYSLLAQSLLASLSFYESAREEEGMSARLLATQASRELQRAREALGPPPAAR